MVFLESCTRARAAATSHPVSPLEEELRAGLDGHRGLKPGPSILNAHDAFAVRFGAVRHDSKSCPDTWRSSIGSRLASVDWNRRAGDVSGAIGGEK
jgi:hypothetical protein